MKTILVTGATSFIGIHLIETLLNDGCSVIAVVRRNSPHVHRIKNHKNLIVQECSLEDIDQLSSRVKEKIDVFYHLAWAGTRALARDDKVIQEKNYEAAKKALDQAIQLGANRFIAVGSQAEYGTINGEVSEDTLTNPITAYGLFKLKAAEACLNNASIDVIWPRIFSVYGKYDYEKSLINFATSLMKDGEAVKLTPCIQNWNYLYVKDVAVMLANLGSYKAEKGIYNLASMDNRILRNYVEEMREILHSNSELLFGRIPYSENGYMSFKPSIKKYLKIFPDMQFTKFCDGYLQTVR